MANTLYTGARAALLEAQLNWLSDDMKSMLIDRDAYTPNFDTHMYLSDVPGVSRMTPGVLLTGKTTTGGAARANNCTFTSVSGTTIESILIYKDTGVEGTSRLVAWLDTATGLPITPNGGDIIVVWDTGANGIFRP